MFLNGFNGKQVIPKCRMNHEDQGDTTNSVSQTEPGLSSLPREQHNSPKNSLSHKCPHEAGAQGLDPHESCKYET